MGPKKAPAPSKSGKLNGKPKPDVTKTSKTPAPKTSGKGAEAAAPPKLGPPPEPEKVGLKQVAGIVMDDPEGKIKSSKWWAYCVDEKGVVGRFMQMRDVNVINALDRSQMDQEVIRKAILGALRFGKPFVFDQMEADMYESLCTLMDGILPGLMGLILNKTIMETENIMKLVKDSDGEEYKSQYAYGPADEFKFIVVTSTSSPTGFLDKMWTHIIE